MQYNKIKQTLGDVYCRESESTKWIKYYGIIRESCLWLCDALVSQSFKISYCLYKTDIEVYEDKVKLPDRKGKEKHKILILSHQYEYETVRLIFKEEEHFDSIVSFIADKSEELSKVTMATVNETNRYPFGKLFLELKGINGLYTNRDMRVDIEFNPYTLKSKTFDGKRNTTVKFNQRFYIPIHNRFNVLKIKLLRFTKEGILSTNKRSDVFKEFDYGLPFLQVSYCISKFIKYLSMLTTGRELQKGVENSVDYRRVGESKHPQQEGD